SGDRPQAAMKSAIKIAVVRATLMRILKFVRRKPTAMTLTNIQQCLWQRITGRGTIEDRGRVDTSELTNLLERSAWAYRRGVGLRSPPECVLGATWVCSRRCTLAPGASRFARVRQDRG